MDRNRQIMPLVDLQTVALRKESVDRNLLTADDVTAPSAVALRKESVDRNRIVNTKV